MRKGSKEYHSVLVCLCITARSCTQIVIDLQHITMLHCMCGVVLIYATLNGPNPAARLHWFQASYNPAVYDGSDGVTVREKKHLTCFPMALSAVVEY